ncbi:LysR family transcriptional regulator (plasmid) [Rhizobium sp. 32-5/1]|uniref:LysR family transcriptional regulator n=1 Tax=Rhizobium sp. 32-5/1 TaxID=3019602 RepID=UPI00240D4491|nr:LysR family transcriptional regulator [Rhizobium sp. 32-5/1]WEZ86186.1 LysR family transcriptional regulator [Rhizobium sp. 32-5/1]
MAIDLRQLRYVIAAAEHGSFRQAAASLGVEVSAISRGIRDLEDGIGASLFSRHSGGVRLTPAGELFLTRARNVVTELETAERDVGVIGRGERGRVRIGIYSSLTSGFL